MREVALVVGEALVDVVRRLDGEERDHPGGSAANAAVALARLGREVWFATAYADDAHGRLLADHLVGNGVELAVDPHVLDRTATAVATLGADGAATYEFDIDWRLPEVTLPGDVRPAAVAWGSIGAALEPGASAVRDLVAGLRGSAMTYFDVNARPAITGTGAEVAARAEEMVSVADLVKASDEDLAVLWPGEPEDALVQRFLDLGVGAVIVTRGPEGASWVSPLGRVDLGMPRVTVADTIGAGDTLGAAAVDELWRRGVAGSGAAARLAALPLAEARDAVAYAISAAAVTVSRPGADPPYRHELTPEGTTPADEASHGGARTP
jgi:fructokinase